MRRFIAITAVSIMVFMFTFISAFAADETFTFTLSADKTSVNVGDEVNVTLKVTCDQGTPYSLFVMQDEIKYNSTMFEVVSGSISMPVSGSKNGSRMMDNGVDKKLLFAIMDANPDGKLMEPETTVLTFKFKALKAGNVEIESINAKLPNGDETERTVKTNKITITVSSGTPDTKPTPTPTPNTGSGGVDGGGNYSTGSRGEIVIEEEKGPLSGITDTHKCFSFTDIDGHWARTAICYAVETGMFNGVSVDKFSPDGKMTRAMLVTVLHRIDGSPEVAQAADFNDTEPDSWYEKAVNWAAGNGIVNGYEAGRFAPDDNITREQMMTIIYRYRQYKGEDVSTRGDISGFSDNSMISVWAIDSIRYGVGAGLIKGDDVGRLNPVGTATRAETAVILSRFSGLDV